MTQPRMVGGRYELGELVGYGGMAEVHRGRDTRLNRNVAIKVLRADLARDPSFINRFRREAHSAAGLNHPSIVSVYDTGEDAAADGTAVPFIVMEYVEGRTLRDVLKSEGKLPVRRAMEIVADICSALDFSHRNGIIHRDIKPANVMITPAGAVKVMDFGIARAVADTSATQTQTANVIGTAQYLSPEQARGETVDARSDVYSTGCLLYELVTGVPPFQGDSPVAVAYQHVRENPVAPSVRAPEVPRALDSIIMKALAKNQLNRYQSAGDMRSDIQRALANQPVQAETVMTDDERTQFIARTPAVAAPLRRPPYEDEEEDRSRRTGLIWAAVVVALLLVIGLGTYLIFGTSGSSGKKDVTVPSVIGQSPESAVNVLTNLGLKPVAGAATTGPCDNNVTVAPKFVCKTEPMAGTTLKEGDTVTYQTFVQGTVQVPLVEGLDFNTAVAQLKAAMLLYKKVAVHQFDGKGTVITQSIPNGQLVAPNTVITITVADGTEKLPDVKGQQLGDAQSTLSGPWPAANVRVTDTVTTSDPKKNNTVAKMSPKAGGYYEQSQIISLTVYKYVQPKPTCTSLPPSPSGGSSSTSTSPSPGQSTSTSPSPGSSSTLPPC